VGSSRARELELFEDQDARPFSEHEPVAIAIERTARSLGIVVPRRECAHRGKPADTHRADRRFGPAGDHHLGGAPPDDLECVAQRVGRRCACRARG
jgi:hypothetical protein